MFFIAWNAIQCLVFTAFADIHKADFTAQSELAGDWLNKKVILGINISLLGGTFCQGLSFLA